MGRMGKMGRIYEAEMFLQKAHFLPSLAWVASYIFPILPIFTQLDRTSIKFQGFFEKTTQIASCVCSQGPGMLLARY